MGSTLIHCPCAHHISPDERSLETAADAPAASAGARDTP
jgi:hypothetical protein